AEAGGAFLIVPIRLRATDRDIAGARSVIESEEVRASRQSADVTLGSVTVPGSFGFELSPEAFDDFLEFGMNSAFYEFEWDGTGTVAASTGGALRGVFTRSSGSWTDDGFRVGDQVAVSGYAGGNNNGTWQILVLTATVMTVYDPLDAITVEASTGSEEFALAGKRIDVGTTKHSFGIERRFEDVDQYQVFKGNTLDKFPVAIQPEAKIKGTMTTLGLETVAMTSSSVSSLTPREAPAYKSISSFQGNLWEGGLLIGIPTGLNFEINNNLQQEFPVFSEFSPEIFDGGNTCTGSLSAYFEDATLQNKFENETASTMVMDMRSKSDPTYFMSVVVPSLLYTGSDQETPQRGPIKQNLPWAALEADLAVAGGTTVPSNLSIQVSNAISAS
ncbi:MAG: hypothetical protein HN750_19400, partial [Gemmatimonadales bacterium]|nr:hypothetical protein [Gemmatimonadales bacterium]